MKEYTALAVPYSCWTPVFIARRPLASMCAGFHRSRPAMTRCFSFATISVSSGCLKSKSVFGNNDFTADCTPIQMARSGIAFGSPSITSGF
jgi:hypothetical protein